MNAARLLRRARWRAGISQAELARRSGVQRQVINRIERGNADPRVATLDRLLAAAEADVAVVPRTDSDIDRTPIRDLLACRPVDRLSPELMACLDRLRRPRIQFVLVGGAAARLHGAPVSVSVLELVVSPHPYDRHRLAAALESENLGRSLLVVDDDFDALHRRASPLPWLPPPTMRVMNRWLDAPGGHLASLEDLQERASESRRGLLAAVEDETDRASPGFRINRTPWET